MVPEKEIDFMKLEERIALLDHFGNYIAQEPTELNDIMVKANQANPWFLKEEMRFALKQSMNQLFNKTSLNSWLSKYNINTNEKKNIGLVLAGNIPMVGLHDVICVFLVGFHSQIKFSEKDNVLIPFIIDKLKEFDPRASDYFTTVDRLSSMDAIIATGSDTSGLYFDKYFGKYPHIIRKHRNSVAILSGEESDTELLALGEDVFRYFGLGCRNVSKIFAPVGYDWSILLAVWEQFHDRMEHQKYKHNFDFNYALYVMNKKAFLHNDSIILCPDEGISSRIGTLRTAHYHQISELVQELNSSRDRIQCLVGNIDIPGFELIAFGQAQCPAPRDYADHIDTIEFLLKLI